MNLSLVGFTLACVAGISVGQMLFRKAALALPAAALWQHWVFNGWLLAALVLYAVTTLGWVWVLRHAPLYLAYPFMGLAFVFVPLLGWAFLGEPLRAPTLAGAALIVAGIAITAQAA